VGGYITINGKKLNVKDTTPSKRSITLQSKGHSSVLPPDPNSGGDPTLWGAEFRLVNSSTSEEQVIPLPAKNWTGQGNPPGSKGYKYKDKTLADGPCKSAYLKAERLKLMCKGNQITFTLDEPSQRPLTATVGFGTDPPYCMVFGGTVKKDEPGIFRAKMAPIAPVCLVP
jgi:hypothetical protein